MPDVSSSRPTPPGRGRGPRYMLARWLRWWRALSAPRQLLLGLLSYALIGTLLLMLPFAQAQPARWIDHLFVAVSAFSTTGLSPVSVADTYTWFGETVILLLIQLGGIGYMTLTSFFILARGQKLSGPRLGVLKAGFTLPQDISLPTFISRVVIFTLLIEAVGAALLYVEFRGYGIENALWWAVFHSVSAFATAGFSLSNTSLEPFRGSVTVNLTVTVLCYLGSIGFIVLQDAWLAARSRQRRITFTSKVILCLTALVLVVGTPLLFLFEPTLSDLPVGERWMAAMFQVGSASTTAGFNSVPIGPLTSASLLVICVVMIIGASPSGTGGGIKTTSVSALGAVVLSVLRGRDNVVLLGHEVPIARVLYAVAATTFYMSVLTLGVFALCLTELLSLSHTTGLVDLFFEATSALGTVGLSMGSTAALSDPGKLVVVALMFAGRAGPLTLGLAMLHRAVPRSTAPGDGKAPPHPASDLAV